MNEYTYTALVETPTENIQYTSKRLTEEEAEGFANAMEINELTNLTIPLSDTASVSVNPAKVISVTLKKYKG